MRTTRALCRRITSTWRASLPQRAAKAAREGGRRTVRRSTTAPSAFATTLWVTTRMSPASRVCPAPAKASSSKSASSAPCPTSGRPRTGNSRTSASLTRRIPVLRTRESNGIHPFKSGTGRHRTVRGSCRRPSCCIAKARKGAARSHSAPDLDIGIKRRRPSRPACAARSRLPRPSLGERVSTLRVQIRKRALHQIEVLRQIQVQGQRRAVMQQHRQAARLGRLPMALQAAGTKEERQREGRAHQQGVRATAMPIGREHQAGPLGQDSDQFHKGTGRQRRQIARQDQQRRGAALHRQCRRLTERRVQTALHIARIASPVRSRTARAPKRAARAAARRRR